MILHLLTPKFYSLDQTRKVILQWSTIHIATLHAH